MKKFAFELFIYLVLTIGALIMLMPFLWMLDTSFKLQSEVLTWPPKWITKNMFSSRDLKVFIDFSRKEGINFEGLTLNELMNLSLIELEKREDSLRLKIFDDPPVRGKLYISILSEDGSNAMYAETLSKSDKEKLLDILENDSPIPKNLDTELSRLVETSNSTLDLTGILFEDFFHSDDSIYNRKKFVDELGNCIDSVLNKLDNYEKKILNHRILRIKETDTDELKIKKELLKKTIKNYFVNKRRSLILLKNELYDYRKGLQNILKLGEIDELIQKLSKIHSIELYVKKDDFKSLNLDPLITFVNKNFDNPIEKWENLLKLFVDFHKFFKTVQRNQLNSNLLIVAYKSDREITDDFINHLKKTDLPDYIVEKAIEFFKKDRSGFLSRVISWMNGVTMEKLKGSVTEDYLQDYINKMSEITTVFRDLNVANHKKEEFLKALFVCSSEQSKEIPSKVKTELINLIGNNRYKLLVRNMENLLKIVDRKNYDKIWNALRNRLELTEYLKTINSVYNDVTTRLNIIEGPRIIKDVRKESGDILAITFDNIRSFWFEDDIFKLKAKFSFTETLLNLLQNYVDAWRAAPFSRYYLNTIFVAFSTTILEIIFASMAAFAFAKLNFFGKNAIFLLFLSTMMVPGEVLLVPNYITLAKFGWLDTYYALIVPWTVSVFAIFLIRQHFLALPNELYDAAKMDGCSDWKFLWEIMVPLSKPVIITAALLKFVGSWNSFLWVLIVTKSPEVRTLPVGLMNFSSEVGTLYNQLMAASTFSVIPVIIVFLFTQKYFIRGIARTGLK